MGRNPNSHWGSPSSSERRRLFRVGSLVEVRSNDEGFRGAWFEATITRLGRSKVRRYSISYSALIADDSSKSPLKETVHRFMLRPRPPPQDPAAAFELEQCVEAFHNEGWWPGVVIKLPEEGGDGSYSVCFPMSREELQFKASEMRRQLKWVRGKWVPVEETQERVHVMFGEGTRVEVSRDREKYGAAWFVGTVQKVIGKTNFLVEYENLRVDSDTYSEMLLKEIVDMQYIRPCPPAPESTSFNVLDEVEGFHQNGWFAGVVTVILPRSRYIVKYKHQEEEMMLDRTLLRPCRVWIGGHWVHISEDQHCKSQTPRGTESGVRRRKSGASSRSSHPISVLKSNDDDGDVADGSSISTLKRKKLDGLSQAPIELSQAIKKSKKGKLLEENSQLVNGMSQNKRGNLYIPVPTFRNNDGEIADRSDAANLNGKDAMGSGLEGEVELSQPCKKLKGNLLVKQLQLVDESKSVGRRSKSHAGKRSSIPILVLTSSKNDGEVADLFGCVNLKDKKAEEPSFKDQSSQPRSKSDKGKSLEEHLQSIDGTLMDCGSKTPAKVGKCSIAAMQMLERIPALVAGQHHSRSPSLERIPPNCKVGQQSQADPSSRELLHGKDTFSVNGTGESIITERRCSSCLDEGTEHQPKEANFVHPLVVHDTADFVRTANCGNGKGNPSPTENTKMRRKKIAIRTPKRLGKTPDVVEMKEQNEGVPPKKITFMNSMKSKQLEEGTELVVGGEDRRDFVELSNQMPTLDALDSSRPLDHHDKVLESKNCSLLTIATEENSPCTDDNSLPDKQADIMEDVHVTPRIESSIINAESLEYSVVRQSQILKSFLSRGEEIWSCANRLTEARAEAPPQALPSHEQDALIPGGTLSDKVVDMERAPIDSTPTRSSPSQEDNICDEGEFGPSMLLSEKVFVEIEDGPPLDPSPSGSSLSREDGVADNHEATPCGSLSERPPVEMEQASCDPAPCRSSHELIPDVLPSVISSSFVNGIGEIQSCVTELGENGREREYQALPACFKEKVASESDELASTGSKSGRNILKDGETALIDPSPMEFSSEKLVLPFIKKSELWELVESKEVFRMLPQQPHFHPLLQHGKEFREGMAIGLMVTFSNLVTGISSLRIVDSQQDFEDKLNALGPLESNGFNIQSVRARLEKLLELGRMLSQSEGKKHSLGAKALELEEVREQNNLCMFSVDKVISELEQNLAQLQKKRASMILEIRKNESEIVNLKTGVQAAEEASISIERHFSTELTAPW